MSADLNDVMIIVIDTWAIVVNLYNIRRFYELRLLMGEKEKKTKNKILCFPAQSYHESKRKALNDYIYVC